MFNTTIVNPTTGRNNTVKGWKVSASALYEDLKAGNVTAKKLSWSLLDDNQSYQAMENSSYGDTQDNNWSLAIFEQGLDWAIGLKILDFIIAIAKAGKKTRDFEVLVTRKGDVFIRLQSGKLL